MKENSAPGPKAAVMTARFGMMCFWSTLMHACTTCVHVRARMCVHVLFGPTDARTSQSVPSLDRRRRITGFCLVLPEASLCLVPFIA